MQVTIMPGIPQGSIMLPTSKSMAHRGILLASLAEGTSVIQPVTDSKDIEATLGGAKALGAKVSVEGQRVTVTGGKPQDAHRHIHVKESGSTLRFLFPIAALQEGETIFTGEGRLMQRPMEVYEEIWKQQGLRYQKQQDGIVSKGKLKSGELTIRGDVSSQFISGLLMTLPLLSGDSVLRILPPFTSKPYVTMTLSIMKQFGAVVEQKEEFTFLIPGNQTYHQAVVQVEQDFSQGAFFLVANALGGKVLLPGLPDESCQGDGKITQFLSSGEAVFDLEDTPDLGPILMVYGALRKDQPVTVLTGAARLRIKESDRIAAMECELRKLGVAIQSDETTVTITRGSIHAPKEVLQGHNDHRVVMSLAIAALFADGPVSIDGISAVTKSYPAFFSDLQKLGVALSYSKGNQDQGWNVKNQ